MTREFGTREFRRPLPPGAVGSAGRTERLEADPAERAALAVRLGLLGLDRLAAEVAVAPATGGALRATGRMVADVVQACVVTLDPVPQRVEAVLDWVLLPAGAEPSDELDDGPDEIEAEPDGSIDLGEALAQELSLCLDPYPRAAGAAMPAGARDLEGSPFAALRALRRN